MQLELGARPAPRVCAVCVPELPLQRALRARAAGAPPVAVVRAGRVVAASAPARAAGVRAGDSAVQAEAACAGLVAVPQDEAADRAALEALAEALLALGPAIEVAPPDVLLLDASGARLLARDAADPDAALAARAVALAAELGFHARAAVATGRGPARALARWGGTTRAVPPDATAAALAPLPLQALELPPAVAARLHAIGVHDARALARLPAAGLGQRFGAAGVAAWRLARGEDGSPLAPWTPTALPRESIELEGPVDCAEPLLFALKRLCDRIAARLAGRGLGATRLALSLRVDLAGGAAPQTPARSGRDLTGPSLRSLSALGEERVEIALAAPSAAATRWLLVLRERVGTLRLEGAVVGAGLEVAAAAPAPPEQLALADRPEELAALDAVLARLAARLGDGTAFAAEPVDRYRPEAAYRAAPFRARGGSGAPLPSSQRGPPLAPAGAAKEAPPAASAEAIDRWGLAATRPTRLLSPPLPLVAQGEGGRVTALRVEGRAYPVLSLSEPERLAGEWWDHPFDREYRRARVDGLGECWIFRDVASGRLWLHGFFD